MRPVETAKQHEWLTGFFETLQVVHCPLTNMVEIAEAAGRTAPGVKGQDFSPYFDALRAGGYQGPIEIEGKWDIEQVAPAIATIRQQAQR